MTGFYIFCVLGDSKYSSSVHVISQLECTSLHRVLVSKQMHQSQRIFYFLFFEIITCRQYLGSNRSSTCCMNISIFLFSSLTCIYSNLANSSCGKHSQHGYTMKLQKEKIVSLNLPKNFMKHFLF